MKKALSLVLLASLFSTIHAKKPDLEPIPISFMYSSSEGPYNGENFDYLQGIVVPSSAKSKNDKNRIVLTSNSDQDKQDLAELIAQDRRNVKCLAEAIKTTSKISKNNKFQNAVANYTEAFKASSSKPELNLYYRYNNLTRAYRANGTSISFKLKMNRELSADDIVQRATLGYSSANNIEVNLGNISECNFENVASTLISKLENETRQKVEENERRETIRREYEEAQREKEKNIEDAKRLIEDFS